MSTDPLYLLLGAAVVVCGIRPLKGEDRLGIMDWTETDWQGMEVNGGPYVRIEVGPRCHPATAVTGFRVRDIRGQEFGCQPLEFPYF